MSTSKKRHASTAICGFDADNILIRKRNLVDDLMGKVTFTELMLLQALGEPPTPAQSRIVDAVLVTIMEHGLVPSAIATRLTHYGAPESFQGAVAAGLLGVGDRYAGTAGECGAILEQIVEVPADERIARALAIVRDYRERRRPVPGFGHPIHQAKDPRVEKLIEIAGGEEISGEFIAAAGTLEQALHEVLGKPLVTNISAAIGAVLGEAGVPSAMMRGVVLTARCAGLVGHLFEEMQNPAAPELWVGAQSAVEYDG
jgi:citrate synthase